jgi:DNA-binding phage protein
MALTRSFKETVRARAQRDPEFRRALLKEALEHLITGDVDTGRAILGTYVNATIGYPELAARSGKSPKSLLRMLGPSGNPTADNLFEIIRILKDHERVQLEIRLKTG